MHAFIDLKAEWSTMNEMSLKPPSESCFGPKFSSLSYVFYVNMHDWSISPTAYSAHHNYLATPERNILTIFKLLKPLVAKYYKITEIHNRKTNARIICCHNLISFLACEVLIWGDRINVVDLALLQYIYKLWKKSTLWDTDVQQQWRSCSRAIYLSWTSDACNYQCLQILSSDL